MSDPLQMFIPLRKADAAQRLIYGYATAELPDRSGEICDYASTKPYYEQWSADFAKASGGKSFGNLRAMHGKVAAGKISAIAFNDEAKRIEIAAKIVDDDEWRKIEEGVYTGFSQGGAYVKRWPDPENPELTRYTAAPSEISLVDLPCLPEAGFELVKADGASERRGFAGASAEAGRPSPAGMGRRCATGWSAMWTATSRRPKPSPIFSRRWSRPQRRSHSRRAAQRPAGAREGAQCVALLQPKAAQKAASVRRAAGKACEPKRCGAPSRRPISPNRSRRMARAGRRARGRAGAAHSPAGICAGVEIRRVRPRRSCRRTGAPVAGTGFSRSDQGRPDPAETFRLSFFLPEFQQRKHVHDRTTERAGINSGDPQGARRRPCSIRVSPAWKNPLSRRAPRPPRA